jgi:hypothetical protein
MQDLELNRSLPMDAFTLDFPSDAEIFREDLGFRRVSLQDIQSIVGYVPLVPTWVPEGYAPAEVTASKKGSVTGAEGANPPVWDVVSLSYRRGLDQLIVTTRPVGPDASLWRDPLASGEGYPDQLEQIVIKAGALAGDEGDVLIDPLAIPHVWVKTDQLVVTVSGDLTRDELPRVVQSLTWSPGGLGGLVANAGSLSTRRRRDERQREHQQAMPAPAGSGKS